MKRIKVLSFTHKMIVIQDKKLLSEAKRAKAQKQRKKTQAKKSTHNQAKGSKYTYKMKVD